MAEIGRKSGLVSLSTVFFLSFVIFTYYLSTIAFVGRPFSNYEFFKKSLRAPSEISAFFSNASEFSASSSSSSSSQLSCFPKTNIFFLKTHKCASSTVQNVIMRYGLRHGLNFVLPISGNYLGANGARFDRRFAADVPWSSLGYNIMCHHTVFDEQEVTSVMPKDTVYVSILRDPVDLFESMYAYANFESRYNRTIEEFVREAITLEDRIDGRLGVNQMLFDFGVKPTQFGDVSSIRRTIEMIDNRFSLIMIVEYFDESMILLQELLCWTLDDVVYFVHNVRRDTMRHRLPTNVRDALAKLNDSDRRLYVHFREQFRRKMRVYGLARMKKRVAELRKRVAETSNYCAAKSDGGNDGSNKALTNRLQDTVFENRGTGRKYISKSNISNKENKWKSFPFQDIVEDMTIISGNRTCSLLAIREMDFTNRLKLRQMDRVIRAAYTGKFVNG